MNEQTLHTSISSYSKHLFRVVALVAVGVLFAGCLDGLPSAQKCRELVAGYCENVAANDVVITGGPEKLFVDEDKGGDWIRAGNMLIPRKDYDYWAKFWYRTNGEDTTVSHRALVVNGWGEKKGWVVRQCE